eukprot:TRINITY_DN14327_c0_g1_i1.p1 TRINITY_DN14327_c0_g1~~TRINITY_DN14327_c0_g1_i1.p1  ORF type:complete len:842 (-),score=160.00 TRINITY_DN14327_c0_g1_i1:214-2622(-)
MKKEYVAATEEVFPDFFEGQEKTLSICFKSRYIASNLRRIPQEAWEEVLKHARCQILSAVSSTPVALASASKGKIVASQGVTAYLLSESSLFVSDTSLSLKTCGQTAPLAALEAILDLVVPTWQKKDPSQYVKYATFVRSGYMRPEEQVDMHTSWEEEVAHLNKYFKGEATSLGSNSTSVHQVYVANYLPKDSFCETVSTQITLTNLDTEESMRRYGPAELRSPSEATPLKTAWKELHGNERRSIANNDPKLDERFFEPIGYSSNGVFGKHFTTIHITPQPGCSYLSVETSMPMMQDGRQRFAMAAQDLCRSDSMTVTEFALCPKLFAGTAPDVPGFELRRSSRTVGEDFACAHHHYERKVLDVGYVATTPPVLPGPVPADEDQDECCSDAVDIVPVIIQAPTGILAARSAAEHFLAHPGNLRTDEPVALLDVTALKSRVETWRRLLPRVEPFYAVKCNPQPAVVKALWDMWKMHGVGGFDCASPAEMELVTPLGVNPAEQIIFANPCKQVSAVNFARKAGVLRLVFDNAAELVKLANCYPEAELVLRVQTDDSLAQCPLSNKFGAAPADCDALLQQARKLGLKVVGISFHVGSGCSQHGAFRNALQRARAAFDDAARAGFDLKILDIGGGFPGWDEEGDATFADHAADIRELLEALFPSPEVRVIAEPGRFFVASTQAMLTTVVSTADASCGNRYYLNDGLYGAFNCVLYDHAVVPEPLILRDGRALDGDSSDIGKAQKCTIFGPTCDGFDVISNTMELAQLHVGDHLLFPNMGAYTTAASTSFNGFAPAACFVYESQGCK